MKRRSKQPSPGDPGSPNGGAIIQFKVWLQGISPMVWRRLQVPASSSLQELHGVIQVAMGWEGIHLMWTAPVVKRFLAREFKFLSSSGESK
jgi:hypothetical protein